MTNNSPSSGLLGSLLSECGKFSPPYDEVVEHRRELELVRAIEIRKYGDLHPRGLFGLGYFALAVELDLAAIAYARANRISLLGNDWRERSILAAGEAYLRNTARKPKRGRPRKLRGSLLGSSIVQDNTILEQVEAVKNVARKHGHGNWSDARCIRFIVSVSEFESEEPRAGIKKTAFDGRCRYFRNKLSALRTTRRRKLSPTSITK